MSERVDRPTPAHEPGDYRRVLPPSLLPLIPAVFAVAALPWALLAAVAVPWFTARHGVVINGEPWLYAPLEQTLPLWVLWVALAAAVATMALAWGTAALIVREAALRPLPGWWGFPSRARVRAAVRGSARRLPGTLVAFAVVGLVLFGVAALVPAASGDLTPLVRVLVPSILFCLAVPLWYPLVGVVLAEDGPRAEFARLRPRMWLPGGPVVGAAALAPCVVAGSLLLVHVPQPWTPVLLWLSAIASLSVSVTALTCGALSLRGDTPGSPALRTPTTQTSPTSPTTPAGSAPHRSLVLLAAALVSAIAVPPYAYVGLLTSGPWDALRHDLTVVDGPYGTAAGTPTMDLLPERGSVLLGGLEFWCDDHASDCVEGKALKHEREEDWGRKTDDPLAVIGGDGDRVYVAHTPDRTEELPEGSIILQEECVATVGCPDPGAQGAMKPNAADDDPGEESENGGGLAGDLRVWGERIDGVNHVVTASRATDGTTELRLDTCRTDSCASSFTTELGPASPALFTTEPSIGPDHEDLVDVAVGPDENVRVSALDPATGALTLYACDTPGCGETTVTELAPGSGVVGPARNGRPGQGTALEVRPDGTPLVALQDREDGSVRLLDCADEHCTGFAETELFGPGWERPMIDLELDSAGLPQIAAADLDGQRVVHLACADSGCAEYERTELGAFADPPEWLRLRLDESDRPYVAWLTRAANYETTWHLLRCDDSHCGA